MLVDSGAVLDRTMIYWDVRPSDHLPTVEVRVSDVPATVDETVLLAVLVRALVVTAVRAVERGELALPVSEQAVRAASWRAAHDGIIEFAGFYRAHIKPLVAFLLTQGASLTTAAEIAQETMSAAYRCWGTITHPKAWTRKAAARAYIRLKLDDRETTVDEVPEPGPLVRTDVEIERWEQRHDLLRAADGLSHRQRQVLALYLEDLDTHEIAAELDIKPGAVREHLSQARKALRMRMDCKEITS
jgi:RNA polymerase sigma factor (sigma-70 family)